MESEKYHQSGATAKPDPNFMLMYYMLDSLGDVGKQVDWKVIRDKIGLPSVTAAQKRWSRLRIAQNAANVSTGEAIPLIKAQAKPGAKADGVDDRQSEQQDEQEAKVEETMD